MWERSGGRVSLLLSPSPSFLWWFSSLLCVLFFLLPWPSVARSHGSFTSATEYYQMIEDISSGKNYYDLLGVPSDASIKDIRSAFRQLSKKWHPDKNKDPEAVAVFRDLVFAKEVLTDSDKRKEYDDYLLNGIPWHDNYYGRYAHRYGAPDHDIRWVLFWLITSLTVGHYAYRYHRYNLLIRVIKNSERYKQRQRLLAQSQGLKTKRVAKSKRRQKNQTQEEEQQQQELEPEVRLVGVSPPTWRDLLVVRLVLLPFRVCRWIYRLLRAILLYKILRRTPPLRVIPTTKEGGEGEEGEGGEGDEDGMLGLDPVRMQMIKERYQMSEEDFEAWKEELRKQKDKMERHTRGKSHWIGKARRRR
ncbi:DnaJ-related protein scj1 [Balamuthia mandrillaris]